MNRCMRKCHKKLLLLVTIVFLGHCIGYSLKAYCVQTDMAEQLQRLLTIRFPGVQVVGWNDDKKILQIVYNNRHGRIHVYGPFEQDFDGDKQNEILLGCKFVDIDYDDFLGVYTLKNDQQIVQIFHKSFERTDMGEFTAFDVEDITGDGMVEILVRYNFVSAGVNTAGWEEFLYIIRGCPPFDTMLKLKVREGWMSNKNGDNYVMETEIHIEDENADGTNEIIITPYRGKDEERLKKMTAKSLIYQFRDGRYQLENNE